LSPAYNDMNTFSSFGKNILSFILLEISTAYSSTLL
jgi:hypothetical protein